MSVLTAFLNISRKYISVQSQLYRTLEKAVKYV